MYINAEVHLSKPDENSPNTTAKFWVKILSENIIFSYNIYIIWREYVVYLGSIVPLSPRLWLTLLNIYCT